MTILIIDDGTLEENSKSLEGINSQIFILESILNTILLDFLDFFLLDFFLIRYRNLISPNIFAL